MKHLLFSIALLSNGALLCQAQFIDDFESDSTDAWMTLTGDGWAEIQFVPHQGFARMEVDATSDPYNVWWGIIKRDVSRFLDMEKLKDPAYELRVEIRLRPSHAPRRANIMINTQRTVDYHKQLREYDIPDTSKWHTISMTTQDLDALPGDQLNVQLGITDWGRGRYHMDIDYYKADIVKVADNGPDLGEPLRYHPPTPDVASFSHHLPVTHDALLNADFPDVSFHNWSDKSSRILTIGARHWPILRWNFPKQPNLQADGAGLLELTTHSLLKGGSYIETFGEDLGIEFGKIRIFEIFGGDPKWDQRSVTLQSFTQDQDIETLLNSQMIFDTELAVERGGKTYITLSRPVMQRLLDGTTKGLIIRPLGAIIASIYDSEDSNSEYAPKLHFNLKP